MSKKLSLQKTNSNELKSLWIRLITIFAIIVLINIIAQFIYKRFDLTSEKRYSLTDTTVKMLKNQKDDIYIKVYLEGDLQTGFLRLKNSTKDILNEMKSISGGKLNFEFINPVKNATTEEEKMKIYQELSAKGLEPTNLKVRTDESYKEQIIFPGLLITIDQKSMPVQILENQIGYSPEEALNHSVISLEYKIANAIKKLTQNKIYNVVFLQGHGEYVPEQVFDLQKKLEERKYKVSFVDVNQKSVSSTGDSLSTWIPENTDLVIIARPLLPFKEVEKYRLDQFVMKGGKILWAIDGMDARMEYLRNENNMFMAKNIDLNLDDVLFKYGVRINKNLVQDGQQSGPIPLLDQRSKEPMLFPWLFNPLLTGSFSHPIGKNLDPIFSQYASSIDTITANNIKKTIVLSTSQYGRALPDPVRVHLTSVKEKPDFKYFKQPFIPVGVLLEGAFVSSFKNRLDNDFIKQSTALGIKPIEQGVENKMIVLSDADLLRNEVSSKGEQYPLGYEVYSHQTFANADFILNCIEYLVDPNDLLAARNKEIKLRLLDSKKVKTESLKWQLINLLIPAILVICFALTYHYVRRRMWTLAKKI